MTSLLSSVSGQFTKSLILGTFLPVVVFVVLGLAFGLPLLPADWPILEQFKALNKEWLTIAASFLSVLITGLLYNLNIPIIRFYEGYPWKSSFFGRAWCGQKAKERKRLRQVRFRLGALKVSWNEVFKDARKQRFDEMNLSLRHIFQQLAARYTDDPDVLPTRLGNTIRSAERYSLLQYGLDAVPLWPRMVAVISKDYLAGIDDAKSAMDFFLNASVLSGFLGIFLLVAGLSYRKPFSTRESFQLWLVELLLSCLAAWQCYRYSNSRAAAWGSMLRASFDLYRFDLQKQMGYHRTPTTRSGERVLWTAISKQVSFGDILADEPQPYADPRFKLTVIPEGLKIATSSGVQPGSRAGELVLFCKIENLEQTSAAKVTLEVNPPEGFEVKWGTAAATDEKKPKASVEPSGSAFDLGEIAATKYLIFECGAILIHAPEEP